MGFKPSSLLLAVALLAAGVAACKVTFTDDFVYTCARDSDCGGDGFTCVPRATGSPVCCRPSGDEVCDGVDNDCDGVKDNSGRAEVCNGQDDDCNGQTDELFNLQTDPNHCGECNRACPPTHDCRNGQCQRRLETICYDDFDNDNDGAKDCADDDCEKQVCGVGCRCTSLRKGEDTCSDRRDNDDDGLVDCLDPDCVGKGFSDGGACVADGGAVEFNCLDGLDNDGDALADCLDDDCVGRYCTPPNIYFQCTASRTCTCNGGLQVAEVGSVLCRDDVDNDCDGKWDCGEASCEGMSCAADGGRDCVCAALKKKEANCGNLVDDDGDLKVDCADDVDCPPGTACGKVGGGIGVCNASKLCE
jgi:hypothetical protein